jgi:hypothetical protein
MTNRVLRRDILGPLFLVALFTLFGILHPNLVWVFMLIAMCVVVVLLVVALALARPTG